jgi:hypothetical protein
MVGNQLFDRIFLWSIWKPENYPQFDYVKQVAVGRMHYFTAFQFAMLVVLYVLTRIEAVGRCHFNPMSDSA